jgi:hypothetical protein
MSHHHQVTKCPALPVRPDFVGFPRLRHCSGGTQRMTLRVILDAERPGRHSHAERGNDQEIATAGLLQGCVSSRNLKAGHQSLWETPELCDGSEAVGLVAHLLTDPPPRCRRDLRRLPQGSRKTSRAAFAFDLASKRESPDTTNRDLGAGWPQVAWSGSSGMDAARGAPRHGWRMAAGPRSVAFVKERRRRSRQTRSKDTWLLGGGAAFRFSSNSPKAKQIWR